MGGIHPDINVIGDDGGDISVARVRALRSDAYIRPNEAGRKVYILENAHTMNASAQNAMLKLLEEGPPYAAFLLLTDNAAALLRTVRSRCETLTLSPVTQAQAEEWLSRRYPDRAREDIVRAARRCEGLLGRAVEELEDAGDAGGQARAAAPELIARLSAGDELAWMEFCVSLEKWDRDSLAALFAEGVLLLRHALVIRGRRGLRRGRPGPPRRRRQGSPGPVPQGPVLRRGRAGAAARLLRLQRGGRAPGRLAVRRARPRRRKPRIVRPGIDAGAPRLSRGLRVRSAGLRRSPGRSLPFPHQRKVLF